MKKEINIIRNGEKVKRFTNLHSLSITRNGNQVPTVNAILGADIVPYILKKSTLQFDVAGEKITMNVTAADFVTDDVTVNITTEYIFNEWNHESVPTNVVKKSCTIVDLLSDSNFDYQLNPWEIRFIDCPELQETFEFEFSRETKDVALDKALNLTSGVVKRFPRDTERVIELGCFGRERDYRLTKEDLEDKFNIMMDGQNIVNMIVPLADKADGGETTLTLRDVLNFAPDKINPDFPIVITDSTINTQGTQVAYYYPQYAPNNVDEYAVLDVEGINIEELEIYEGTMAVNDIQAVGEDGKEITDDDRTKAALTLYNSSIRYLKNHRRQWEYKFSTYNFVDNYGEKIDVLDKIKVDIKSCMSIMTECNPFETESVMNTEEWLYVESITMTLEECVWKYDVTLSKDLTPILGNRVY